MGNTVMGETGHLTQEHLPFTSVSMNVSRNSRFEYPEARIRLLAEDIQANGLIAAPLVLATPEAEKPYDLLAGFRRVLALKMLGRTSSDFRVVPAGTPLQKAITSNLSENVVRDGLTTYEIAMQCRRLYREFKVSPSVLGATIRSTIGEAATSNRVSESHVRNLIGCAEQLCDEVLIAWRDQNPRATLANLFALKTRPHDEQRRVWEVLLATSEKVTPSKWLRRKTLRRPNEDQIRRIMTVIARARNQSQEWREGARVALAWAAGDRENFPELLE
jgi:ParB-like nuclease family protein